MNQKSKPFSKRTPNSGVEADDLHQLIEILGSKAKRMGSKAKKMGSKAKKMGSKAKKNREKNEKPRVQTCPDGPFSAVKPQRPSWTRVE